MDIRGSAFDGNSETYPLHCLIGSLESKATAVATRMNVLGGGRVQGSSYWKYLELSHSSSLSIPSTPSSSIPQICSSWWGTPQPQLLPSSPRAWSSLSQKPLWITFCIQGLVCRHWDTKMNRTRELSKGVKVCLCEMSLHVFHLKHVHVFDLYTLQI